MQRLALIALASIPCFMSEADAASLDIAKDLSFIEQQVTKTLDSLGSVPAANPLYPVSGGDSGTWTTRSPSNVAQGWTTGFFPGQLWLLYQATRSTKWLDAAQAWTAPLATQDGGRPNDPTDIGFIIGTSFGNGYRLTGDPAYKQILNTTGTSLSLLYNSKVGAVQSWTFPEYHFPVIIDSMMTLGPLQWGASNGGSSTWAGMANTHAQTVATNLVRMDGSTYQLSDFNPVTGLPESPQYYQTGAFPRRQSGRAGRPGLSMDSCRPIRHRITQHSSRRRKRSQPISSTIRRTVSLPGISTRRRAPLWTLRRRLSRRTASSC